jgi:hypothetical protein
MDPLRDRFEAIIRADDDLMRLLQRLRSLHLPQWRLVAGCLYQTVWNALTARPRGTGIKDYDLVYFDSADLSWKAEDIVIQHVAAVTHDCIGPVETRNQARVHVWFADRFGCAYPQLACADEALGYYASIVHAVGVRLDDDDGLDIAAPFGLRAGQRRVPYGQSRTCEGHLARGRHRAMDQYLSGDSAHETLSRRRSRRLPAEGEDHRGVPVIGS